MSRASERGARSTLAAFPFQFQFCAKFFARKLFPSHPARADVLAATTERLHRSRWPPKNSGSAGRAGVRIPWRHVCALCNLLVVEPHGGAMRFACKVGRVFCATCRLRQEVLTAILVSPQTCPCHYNMGKRLSAHIEQKRCSVVLRPCARRAGCALACGHGRVGVKGGCWCLPRLMSSL